MAKQIPFEANLLQEKKVNLGLKNAAQGLRPWAAFSRLRTQYGLPSRKKITSISTIIQVKGNFGKTRRMIKGMKIVKHVNSTTQQLQPEQLLYFHRAFSLSLGGNNLSVCHGLSRNLSLDFANMCQFKRFLTDYSLISPEQKLHLLKVHL